MTSRAGIGHPTEDLDLSISLIHLQPNFRLQEMVRSLIETGYYIKVSSFAHYHHKSLPQALVDLRTLYTYKV